MTHCKFPIGTGIRCRYNICRQNFGVFNYIFKISSGVYLFKGGLFNEIIDTAEEGQIGGRKIVKNV